MRLQISAVIVGLSILSIFGQSPSVARVPDAEQFPNLVPMAPADLSIGVDDEEGLPALRFSAWIWNRGEYAFELLGRPRDPNVQGDAEAEQCVAWAGPRVCSERKSIGNLAYHENHGHYHFEDFARYELRRFRRNGTVNLSPKGLVATSDKVSFCLQDVRQGEDAVAPNVAPWPLYYGCFAGMGVQGISPGWIDIYGPRLSGQFVPLSMVPDGTYALVINTDPGGRVFESDDSDNVSVTGLQLLGGGSSLTTFCTGLPGSVVCDQPPEVTEEP